MVNWWWCQTKLSYKYENIGNQSSSVLMLLSFDICWLLLSQGFCTYMTLMLGNSYLSSYLFFKQENRLITRNKVYVKMLIIDSSVCVRVSVGFYFVATFVCMTPACDPLYPKSPFFFIIFMKFDFSDYSHLASLYYYCTTCTYMFYVQ